MKRNNSNLVIVKEIKLVNLLAYQLLHVCLIENVSGYIFNHKSNKRGLQTFHN
jgi:hypothetical protein